MRGAALDVSDSDSALLSDAQLALGDFSQGEDWNRLSAHMALHQDGLEGKVDRKAPNYPVASREEFVNHKIAPKLGQQLKVSLRGLRCVSLPGKSWIKKLRLTKSP